MSRDRIKHIDLIRYMKGLNYKSSEIGICFGVAHMAMQAILAGDYQRFNARLADINERPENPSPDIRAFLDGIEIYHNSRYYKHLSETGTVTEAQNSALALTLVQPTSIEKKGGIESMVSFSGAYASRSELTEHFKIFRAALLSEPELKSPVAFILNDANHAIAVGFDPTKNKWLLADAEDLPIKEIDSDMAIALAVKYALNGMLSKAAIFSTTIYATKAQSIALDRAFSQIESNPEWEKIHTVTPEKAVLIDKQGTSWLLITHHIETMYKLLLAGANPNQQAQNGLTALRMALQNRDIEMAKMLLDFGANPNIATKKGITPFMSAAYQNLSDFFILLLEKGGNLDQKDEKGLSARMISAMPGHEKIAKALREFEEKKAKKMALSNQDLISLKEKIIHILQEPDTRTTGLTQFSPSKEKVIPTEFITKIQQSVSRNEIAEHIGLYKAQVSEPRLTELLDRCTELLSSENAPLKNSNSS